MSDDEFQDVRKLIALKRYEQPPENYVENFLEEFQSRQRSELLQQSSRGLFWERFSTYVGELGRAKWAYAGATACTLFGLLFALGTQLGSNENDQQLAGQGSAFAPNTNANGTAGTAGSASPTNSLSEGLNNVIAPSGNAALPNLNHTGNLVPVGSFSGTGSGQGVSIFREF